LGVQATNLAAAGTFATQSAVVGGTIVSTSQLPGERFRRHRFGHGYDVDSVDAFLARAELGGITAMEVEEAIFKSVRFGGYDMQEVDDGLDVLIERLRDAGIVGTATPRPRSWLSRHFGN
jgi:DivIVA domain-containing protein